MLRAVLCRTYFLPASPFLEGRRLVLGLRIPHQPWTVRKLSSPPNGKFAVLLITQEMSMTCPSCLPHSALMSREEFAPLGSGHLKVQVSCTSCSLHLVSHLKTAPVEPNRCCAYRWMTQLCLPGGESTVFIQICVWYIYFQLLRTNNPKARTNSETLN